jgi:hypothetical protein
LATPAYNSSILKTSGAAISFTDEATTASSDRKRYTISTSSKRYLDIDTAVVVQAEHDEVQTVTITGSPSGGNFTLTFGANTTATIAFNASATAVQTALRALASIGSGNVNVSGSNGGPYTVEFVGSLANASQSLLTKDASGLTGGSSPNVAIARVQAGSTWATVSSATYTLIYPGATVIFASAQAQGTTVRLHSGKYYAYATIGGGHTLEFNGKFNLEDTTEWNTTGTLSFTPTVKEGDMKWDVWYANATHLSALMAGSRLIVSAVLPDSSRFEGYCYYSDTTLKGDVKGVLDSSLAFHFTDQFYMY